MVGLGHFDDLKHIWSLAFFQSLVMLCLAASRIWVITLLWVFDRESIVKFNRARSGVGDMFILVICEISEKTLCQYCDNCEQSHKVCSNVPVDLQFLQHVRDVCLSNFAIASGVRYLLCTRFCVSFHIVVHFVA